MHMETIDKDTDLTSNNISRNICMDKLRNICMDKSIIATTILLLLLIIAYSLVVSLVKVQNFR